MSAWRHGRWMRAGIAAVVLLLAGSLIWWFFPQRIDRTLQGYEFTAGQPERPGRSLTLKLEGTLQRTLAGFWKGAGKFEGKLVIVGESYSGVPEDATPFFYLHDGVGSMAFSWLKRESIGNSVPGLHVEGMVYASTDLKELVIIRTSRSAGANNGSVVAVAAPANDREEGMALANRILIEKLGAPLMP
ncbi:hypothetical protein B8V81_1213 [Paenibacillus pasadenensis]|uniref:Uncharacterized protein n=1 Tax=Paenibacillus pasadenensis TaxID=217090 RepID=A0A2N5N9I4_9BACL|nr:hypothetical protein [Paenibacillus pasadenensis]PLT46989.1 hypothetical protein B8V81_1213 [Paenibacillus pasadenensis]